METSEALLSRRNVREYRTTVVPDADLDRIAEAGRRAPSSNNDQRRDFVLVTNREKLVELSTVWQGAVHIAGAAAAFVLVVPEASTERQRLTDQYDLGQATFAIMIAAADLGIGTAHSGVHDQVKARSILGIPAEYTVSYMIGVGYPINPLHPLQQLNRRPFNEVVHREHW